MDAFYTEYAKILYKTLHKDFPRVQKTNCFARFACFIRVLAQKSSRNQAFLLKSKPFPREKHPGISIFEKDFRTPAELKEPL